MVLAPEAAPAMRRALPIAIPEPIADRAVTNLRDAAAANFDEIERRLRALESRASAIEVIPPWILVGSGSAPAPAFENSWVNFDTGAHSLARFSLDQWGRVWLEGTIKSGTVGASVFTLPVGYRPLAEMSFACVANAGAGDVLGRLVVRTTGVVAASGGNTYFILDGSNFTVR